MPMVLVTLVIVWVAVISNQMVVVNVMNRLILLNVSGKMKCSNYVTIIVVIIVTVIFVTKIVVIIVTVIFMI